MIWLSENKEVGGGVSLLLYDWLPHSITAHTSASRCNRLFLGQTLVKIRWNFPFRSPLILLYWQETEVCEVTGTHCNSTRLMQASQFVWVSVFSFDGFQKHSELQTARAIVRMLRSRLIKTGCLISGSAISFSLNSMRAVFEECTLIPVSLKKSYISL